MPTRALISGLGVLAAIAVLPLAGALATGHPLEEFLVFPPRFEIPSNYPRWSWVACGLVLLPFALFGSNVRRLPRQTARPNIAPPAAATLRERRALPWWGWLAIAWTLLWWLLAWTRWEWFSRWQLYTFFPLWLGFIVGVNALTFRATGSCGMLRAPRTWLLLFGVSGGFWWMFEWLNRFVHNWHYLGVEAFTAPGYFVHASMCFSTVLPAVAAVSEWLGTRTAFREPWLRGPAWRWLERRGAVAALLFGGGVALALTGVWPERFYPALWGAPLALLLGASALARGPGVWRELAAGDWSRAGTWMLAALICGGFWEMWNLHSAAKWIYTVPYVDRAHLFEMPALGYLGYLPFGLECLLVVERVSRSGGRQT